VGKRAKTKDRGASNFKIKLLHMITILRIGNTTSKLQEKIRKSI